MPKLLGSLAYKTHFANFQGTKEDLKAEMSGESGVKHFYEGADMDVCSEAIRLIASDSVDDQGRGASLMFHLDGAGSAITSGFLHLLHPGHYGLVNSPTRAPFQNDGLLNVSSAQRKTARDRAATWFSETVDLSSDTLGKVFRWEALLREVFEICGFEDYPTLDQFLWTLSTEPAPDSDDRLRKAVSEIELENTQIRRAAETKARHLIKNNLGSLSAVQLSELFTLINTCKAGKGVGYVRFSPAFVGHNANQLIDNLDETNEWIEKLWTTADEDISTLLSHLWTKGLAGAGQSFPSAILYLRNPEEYAVWTSNLEKALYSVLSGTPAKFKTGFNYLQYCKGVRQLREKENFPPEMHDFVLSLLISKKKSDSEQATSEFAGFSGDAFKFLSDLERNNSVSWFGDNKQRYEQTVSQPIRALLADLSKDFATPRDPELETSPKKCLARINRNTFGNKEAAPYNTFLWFAFFRKQFSRTTDGQLFVIISPDRLKYGLCFGEDAGEVRGTLVQTVRNQELLVESVLNSLKSAGFEFRSGEDIKSLRQAEINSVADFASFVQATAFELRRKLSPQEVVERGVSLKNDIAEDFQLLYPLLRMATPDVSPGEVVKLQEATDDNETEKITIGQLAEKTHLEEGFFEKLDLCLKDKRQLIFVGPPGTGKTFVAKQYANYLAQYGGDVRTVQFHPSYAYEDFIEGLRPVPSKTGAATFEVEAGIFKRLCDDARASPKSTYVLLIDEINRGNIPRIFGELMFLLEHRDEKTELPYSKKPFSIPKNVVVLGTMNSSDRSIALMDLALRRRFHFMQMEPRKEVLLAWIEENHKPKSVAEIFDRLNVSLRDAGVEEDRLVGHAHFMSVHLDEDFMSLIWEATIMPLLKEYFFAEPEKLKQFELEQFMSATGLTATFDEEEPEDVDGLDTEDNQ
ncbi:hypothetical protein CKO51_25695 [Rhodopirellula sp. SM50]|nr:DUF2461 family protein [Rhodopirellula sp. SM50]PAY16684.1 hypothetical protein CKO51_25695 [Rhodopirellula sp. SM50]